MIALGTITGPFSIGRPRWSGRIYSSRLVFGPCEDASCLLDILVYLSEQRRHAFEVLLIAQMCHKVERKTLAVQISVEIEQVRLNDGALTAVKGGSLPDVNHRRHPLVADPGPGCIDAACGYGALR